MKKTILFIAFWSISDATIDPKLFLQKFNLGSWMTPFSQRSSPVLTNICVYSSNPDKFKPKCFLCPTEGYPKIISACADVPKVATNVTFTQADCIEKNCKINYPRGGRRRRQAGNERYGNTVILISWGDPTDDTFTSSDDAAVESADSQNEPTTHLALPSTENPSNDSSAVSTVTNLEQQEVQTKPPTVLVVLTTREIPEQNSSVVTFSVGGNTDD